MTRRHCTLGIAIVALLIPGQAFADRGWPSLYLLYGLRNSLLSFWYLVSVSLLVEALLLRRVANLSWGRAALVSTTMNLASALVGYTVPALLGQIVDQTFHRTSGLAVMALAGADVPNGYIYWAAWFLGMLIITFLVELAVLHLVFRVSWKRGVQVAAIANVVTYGLAALSLFTRILGRST